MNLDIGLKYFVRNGPSVWIHTIACTHVFLVEENKQETSTDSKVLEFFSSTIVK